MSSAITIFACNHWIDSEVLGQWITDLITETFLNLAKYLPQDEMLFGTVLNEKEE